MSFDTAFWIFNGVALLGIVGFLVWRVLSMRRNPEEDPQNLTPFVEDDVLEGRRLERVLGWALAFTVVMLVALLAYFIWEPFRSEDADAQFLERSVERGAVLFANEQSEHYESEFSLLCADCHGVDGTGGVALFTLQPEADECQAPEAQGDPDRPECLPQRVQWTAPDLTLAPLRYDRAQLVEIITFGRPGTPMPAWGVESGRGSKNTQSIDDLVNYLESIAKTPEQARQEAEDAIEEYRQSAIDLVDNGETGESRSGLAVDLEEARRALAEAEADPSTSAEELERLREDVARLEAELARAIEYRDEVLALSDGGILFRVNCARCHTKGWSYLENEPANVDLPPIPPQGSGAYGPNLRDGSVLLQFPGQAGLENQIAWVAEGVEENGQYGQRGISSGRMPHFGRVLTDEQIRLIVEYERSL